MPSVLSPQRPHQHAFGCCAEHEQPTDADLMLLDALTAPTLKFDPSRYKRRDAPLDPLLFAAATLSGPQVTRHHYHHGFSTEEAAAWLEAPTVQQTPVPDAGTNKRYTSKQAPRRERLGTLSTRDVNKENESQAPAAVSSAAALRSPSAPAPPLPAKRRNTLLTTSQPASSSQQLHEKSPYLLAPETPLAPTAIAGVEVQCLVRTRIPTAHGEVLLHLYRNNRDNKEHMAIVVDQAQLRPLDEQDETPLRAPSIRSRSLDMRWSDAETDMDRIVRGAYVGRLTQSALSSSATTSLDARQRGFSVPVTGSVVVELPPPLIRIHSECFTGETVGSMRCDCGEQLDEAVRRIAQPVKVQTPVGPVAMPGRGVVLYLRQEGRGIGLLSKLRAYNLQDLGHDTVAANLMLGHGADERRYEVAAAILRDLDLGDGVRLLTNNPDKIASLAAEGIRVAERVEMVPKAWRCAQDDEAGARTDGSRLGAHTPHGEDLERYLKTKITRMGHLLDLPPSA